MELCIPCTQENEGSFMYEFHEYILYVFIFIANMIPWYLKWALNLPDPPYEKSFTGKMNSYSDRKAFSLYNNDLTVRTCQ